ncbi:O-antigen translocase [Paralcaligenes sp. KSB-10]|uniref:O-antigen translocase n=1 Tax=Paralcaligenes sp. KSB-10 TaxID=2901142 RepID=UPI001E2B685C|nr:O-antigen translocase [Paralcaligenes sp. KSB-10]UHL63242.1 O-antigen translocase [Paralcaligenes sp. KSB-10]
MHRLKAALHFASSTLVKIAAGLFVIKFLAWKLGPDGFGLLGQLMTLVAITGMLAGGGIGNGLIKALSQSPANTREGGIWVSTAFTLAVLFATVIASMLIMFSPAISKGFLGGNFATVIIFLSLSQVFIGFGVLIQAEASSRGDSSLFATINIIGTLLGSIILAGAVVLSGLHGAAYGVTVTPVLTGIVAIFFVVRKHRHLLRYCKLRFDFERMRFLLSFSSLTLMGAISVPVAQMLIRNSIGQHIGWNQAGLWQGVIKISDVYMQFVGVILINYALPRLAALAEIRQSLAELRVILSWLLVTLLFGFFCIYVFRYWVIKLLFSQAFLPMADYFLPQMLGDLLRTTAAAISFMFISKGLVKIAFVFEASQGLLLFGTFKIFEGSTGGMAPFYAHVSTYFIATVAMVSALVIWAKMQQK